MCYLFPNFYYRYEDIHFYGAKIIQIIRTDRVFPLLFVGINLFYIKMHKKRTKNILFAREQY